MRTYARVPVWVCTHPPGARASHSDLSLSPANLALYSLQKVWYRARLGGDRESPSSRVSVSVSSFPGRHRLSVCHIHLSLAKVESWEKLTMFIMGNQRRMGKVWSVSEWSV